MLRRNARRVNHTQTPLIPAQADTEAFFKDVISDSTAPIDHQDHEAHEDGVIVRGTLVFLVCFVVKSAAADSPAAAHKTPGSPLARG